MTLDKNILGLLGGKYHTTRLSFFLDPFHSFFILPPFLSSLHFSFSHPPFFPSPIPLSLSLFVPPPHSIIHCLMPSLQLHPILKAHLLSAFQYHNRYTYHFPICLLWIVPAPHHTHGPFYPVCDMHEEHRQFARSINANMYSGFFIQNLLDYTCVTVKLNQWYTLTTLVVCGWFV